MDRKNEEYEDLMNIPIVVYNTGYDLGDTWNEIMKGTSIRKRRTTPTAPKYQKNVALFNVKFVVSPSWKHIAETINKFQTMFKILQDVEKWVIMT